MSFFGKKYLTLFVSMFMVYAGLNAQIRTVPNQNPQQPPTQQQKQQEVEEEPERQKQQNPGFTDFKSHLWYGGGLSLGFGAYNGQSSFGFGISPMVGYKIIEQISVGPRVNFYYSSYKYPGYKTLNLFNVEAGAFIRGRIFRGFFLQGEISNEWVQEPADYLSAPNTIAKYNFQRFNQYLGAGYNFGNGMGGFGSEISMFYNFAIAEDLATYENPLEYRFTFTYRF